VLQGLPDEVNNALLRTVGLHENAAQCPVLHAVPRNVQAKVQAATLSMLGLLIHKNPGGSDAVRSCCATIAWCWCHYHVSHTPALPILPQKLRKRVKSAMKGKDAVRMLRCLAGMPLGPCLVTLTADARKSFAFQLGQALGLLLGVELYTKGEVQPLRRAVVAPARVTGCLCCMCLCCMCPLFCLRCGCSCCVHVAGGRLPRASRCSRV